MAFDVFTELPDIFFTVAAVVDTGVPRGAGHLVVDRDVCGSRDIPFHGGPGHGPEADRLDQPRGPGEAGAPQCKELLFTLPVLLFS